LELSRPIAEKEGIRIAAISYDSEETLRQFAEKYHIRFPLLSDRDSTVIRGFGILNTNIAPGLRAHGVPHPVQYLIAPDGIVIRKYFVPNYQHRVTASAVVLREFGAVSEDAPAVKICSGALTAKIGFSAARAFAGQEISFFAKFSLEPGWHIYGAPLPAAWTTTDVTFEGSAIIRQSFELPSAAQMRIAALGKTLPVYSGSFQALGSLLLRFPIDAGRTMLSGRVRFQQCSDAICEAPEEVPFELPVILEPFVIATRSK
jgi:AhpC/TSA family/Disulphide bond corrector protein DsbC